MDRYHGKGEWEDYGGKTKEIGIWDEHQKQGEFQCYNQSGALTHKPQNPSSRNWKLIQ